MQDVKFSFGGKNFVVVGASSGMGRQVAIELAQAGANVLCLARRVEIIEQMKQDQGAGKIIPAFVDVTSANPSDWDGILKNFVSEHGKLDGGVYTAGIVRLATLRRWKDEVAREVMETSYWGMLKFIQSATKKKFVNNGSSFVVFSSTAASSPAQGQLFYAAAKSAVQVVVKTIAKEIAVDRHRINSISPGWVKTEMTDKFIVDYGRPEFEKTFWLGEGTAKEVSGMVLFLLSSRASWITGTDVVVDGGQLLGVI